MIEPVLTDSQTAQFTDLVRQARDVVITCHMSPDGDAIGSSLALQHVLRQMPGKRVRVITPDMMPEYLRVLPGAKDVMAYSAYGPVADQFIASAGLIFCLDYNEMSRIDRLAPAVEASPAPRIHIDHHEHPTLEAALQVSRPEASSTCSLLYRVLFQAGLSGLVNKDAATCIYTGMMTDTGNFAYNSNDPELYYIILALMRKGIDKDAIWRQVWNVHTLSSLRLRSYVLGEKLQIWHEHHTALYTLDNDELNRFDYHRGDTEGLINVPLSIPGIRVSISLRQDEEYVKVSMRSIGQVPVDQLCRDLFHGGGHHNAAGANIRDLAAQQIIDRIHGAFPQIDAWVQADPIRPL